MYLPLLQSSNAAYIFRQVREMGRRNYINSPPLLPVRPVGVALGRIEPFRGVRSAYRRSGVSTMIARDVQMAHSRALFHQNAEQPFRWGTNSTQCTYRPKIAIDKFVILLQRFHTGLIEYTCRLRSCVECNVSWVLEGVLLHNQLTRLALDACPGHTDDICELYVNSSQLILVAYAYQGILTIWRIFASNVVVPETVWSMRGVNPREVIHIPAVAAGREIRLASQLSRPSKA